MKQYAIHVRTPTGDRIITVYADSRKKATKVFKEQWGSFLNYNYSIDAIFEVVV